MGYRRSRRLKTGVPPWFLAAVLLVSLLVFATRANAGPDELRPVSSADHWRTEPGVWRWEDGVLHGHSLQSSFAAVRDTAVSTSVVVEGRAVPTSIVGTHWKSLGVGIYLDARNF